MPPDAKGKRYAVRYVYDADANHANVSTVTDFALSGSGDPAGTDPADTTRRFIEDDEDPTGAAVGLASTADFDGPSGRVKTRTDANGNATTYTYDAYSRVRTITSPDGGVATFAYHPDDAQLPVRDGDPHRRVQPGHDHRHGDVCRRLGTRHRTQARRPGLRPRHRGDRHRLRRRGRIGRRRPRPHRPPVEAVPPDRRHTRRLHGRHEQPELRHGDDHGVRRPRPAHVGTDLQRRDDADGIRPRGAHRVWHRRDRRRHRPAGTAHEDVDGRARQRPPQRGPHGCGELAPHELHLRPARAAAPRRLARWARDDPHLRPARAQDLDDDTRRWARPVDLRPRRQQDLRAEPGAPRGGQRQDRLRLRLRPADLHHLPR